MALMNVFYSYAQGHASGPSVISSGVFTGYSSTVPLILCMHCGNKGVHDARSMVGADQAGEGGGGAFVKNSAKPGRYCVTPSGSVYRGRTECGVLLTVSVCVVRNPWGSKGGPSTDRASS